MCVPKKLYFFLTKPSSCSIKETPGAYICFRGKRNGCLLAHLPSNFLAQRWHLNVISGTWSPQIAIILCKSPAVILGYFCLCILLTVPVCFLHKSFLRWQWLRCKWFSYKKNTYCWEGFCFCHVWLGHTSSVYMSCSIFVMSCGVSGLPGQPGCRGWRLCTCGSWVARRLITDKCLVFMLSVSETRVIVLWLVVCVEP